MSTSDRVAGSHDGSNRSHGGRIGRAASSRTSPGGRHHLPADLTRFIGREPEISEVTRLLPTTRLLTLAGSAGAGKTRLALRVGTGVADQYRDGVWLVELAPLADPHLVPKAVADALAVPEQPGRRLRDSLVDAIGPRQLLLVLDNCEHLVQACAELVEGLLRACPELRVLATSRQSLHVAGETTWRVPSMSLPATERLPSAEDLARYDATRLFVERAAAALPSFAASPQNQAAIVRICVRLDGIPLAIELAAARVGVLGLDRIEERLNDRFRILTRGSPAALPRQQTLRATLDWSHALLSEPERVLFRRLAVFAGGWTLDAAEAVGAGDGLATEEVLGVLADLVDKSLVVADEMRGSVRYRFLETMREYGWERLRAAGEAPSVRDRHGAWFLALAEEADGKIRGVDQADRLSRLEDEHDNLRAALAWYLAEGHDAEAALRLAGSLGWFWRLRGHIGEGRRWLSLALATSADTSASTRTRALNGAGLLAYAQADYASASALFEESLRLARAGSDVQAAAWALHGLGRVRHATDEVEGSDAVLQESLNLFRQCQDLAGCAYTLYFLAHQARIRGDYVGAAALYHRALDPARAVGDDWILGWIDVYRADLALLQGDFPRAEALYRDGLSRLNKLRATWGIAVALLGLAGLARERGQLEQAARLYGAEQALRSQLGTARDRPNRRGSNRTGLAAARDALGPARFDMLMAEGQAMSLDEVVAYALAAEHAESGPARPSEKKADSSRSPLTPRESEVAVLIARGLSNREIAEALFITPRTADTHVMNILTKLGLHSRARVAAWAAERGLLTRGDRRRGDWAAEQEGGFS